MSPLSAAAAGIHDPFGHLDAATPAAGNAVAVRGWAGDPDDLSQPLTVNFVIDGAPAGHIVSSISRPDASAAKGVGSQAGFAGSLPLGPGQHLVCASAVNVGQGAAGSLGCLTVVMPGLTPAIVAAHSPSGMLDHVAVVKNTVTLTGWALDPDSLSQPLKVTATVDGHAAILTKAVSYARPDVAKVKHSGPNQGYQLTTTIIANGQHTLCTTAANLWVGANKQLGCGTVQIGSLTAAQIAAHSPSGALESAAAESANSLRLNGWASDPDGLAGSINVVGYLDGVSARTVLASLSRPDLVASKKAGAHAGFSFAIPTQAGAHNVCVWAVNIGIGTNTFLGCAALSTVGITSGPAPATPGANIKATATAAKFLGGKYVWGGEDPKVGFDCSGLVQYSYRVGAGINTPRTAQDQFLAARMISAGRAVAGDLVFFHDSTGSVYHVGIYIGGGMMYAAVDEAEGIRKQQIWDSTATFGSFTHS
jgi:cell wall-associated NlpC family hydrolase